MVRGVKKIKLLNENAITPPPEGKGEASNYDNKTRCLIYRYIYHSSKIKKQDEILQTLQKEFFLSSGRIADILIENSEHIKTARRHCEARSNLSQIKREYPGFSWA